MTLAEQVYAQASVMLLDLDEADQQLLKILCQAAVSHLTARLREGLEPEDIASDFLSAASLYAVAALSEAGTEGRIEQFTAGDLTLRRGSGNAAACCLRYQAELVMLPYLQQRFYFSGV